MRFALKPFPFYFYFFLRKTFYWGKKQLRSRESSYAWNAAIFLKVGEKQLTCIPGSQADIAKWSELWQSTDNYARRT